MIFCVILSGAMVRKVVISWAGFGKDVFPSGISVQTYHLQTMSTCNRVDTCTMEHCNNLTSETPHDRSYLDILAIAIKLNCYGLHGPCSIRHIWNTAQVKFTCLAIHVYNNSSSEPEWANEKPITSQVISGIKMLDTSCGRCT